jgi:hypothetical protein
MNCTSQIENKGKGIEIMNEVMIQVFQEYNQIVLIYYTELNSVEDKYINLSLLLFHWINIRKLCRMIELNFDHEMLYKQEDVQLVMQQLIE